MSTHLVMQDVIIGVAFLGAVALYAFQLFKRFRETLGESLARRRAYGFFFVSLLFLVILMVIGVLHQQGSLVGMLAYVIFGVVALGYVIALRLTQGGPR